MRSIPLFQHNHNLLIHSRDNGHLGCFQVFFWLLQIKLLWTFMLRHCVNMMLLFSLYGLWNSPGCNTGVSSLSLLQRLFPTLVLNWGLLQCRQFLYQLSYQGTSLKTLFLTFWDSRKTRIWENTIGLRIYKAQKLLTSPWLVTFKGSQSQFETFINFSMYKQACHILDHKIGCLHCFILCFMFIKCFHIYCLLFHHRPER